MEELTIEQKAQRYDEILKEAIIAHKDEDKHLKATLERIVYELKENEDEKIRKWLIGYFNQYIIDSMPQVFGNGLNVKDVIAWLEKQGKDNIGISEATKQKLEDNLNKALEKETSESWNEFLEKQGEQKPAWSEDDNRMCKAIIDNIQAICEEGYFVGNIDSDELIKWLESLKERYTWKPSDEHYELEEFAKIVRCNLTGISKAVQELFEAKYLQLTGNKMYGGYKD